VACCGLHLMLVLGLNGAERSLLPIKERKNIQRIRWSDDGGDRY